MATVLTTQHAASMVQSGQPVVTADFKPGMSFSDWLTLGSFISWLGLFFLGMGLYSGDMAVEEVKQILIAAHAFVFFGFYIIVVFLKSANRMQTWNNGFVLLAGPLLILGLWLNGLRLALSVFSITLFFIAEMTQKFVRIWEDDLLSSYVWAIFISVYSSGLKTKITAEAAAYEAELALKEVEIEKLNKANKNLRKSMARTSKDMQVVMKMDNEATDLNTSVGKMIAWYEDVKRNAKQGVYQQSAYVQPVQPANSGGKKGKGTNNNNPQQPYIPSYITTGTPLTNNGNGNGNGKRRQSAPSP